MSRKSGGGDWRWQTVNKDQTKVNEDKLGKGKEKRMKAEEGGGQEGQQRRIGKQRKGVCVCVCVLLSIKIFILLAKWTFWLLLTTLKACLM